MEAKIRLARIGGNYLIIEQLLYDEFVTQRILISEMKIPALLLAMIVLTSCSSVVIHTKSPSVVHLLGQKTLTEDVVLCLNREKNQNNPSDIELELLPSSYNLESYQKIHPLSKGTPVEIFRIEERKFLNLWKYQWWVLAGKTSIDGKEIEFYYMFTLTTNSPESPHDPTDPVPWN